MDYNKVAELMDLLGSLFLYVIQHINGILQWIFDNCLYICVFVGRICSNIIHSAHMQD